MIEKHIMAVLVPSTGFPVCSKSPKSPRKSRTSPRKSRTSPRKSRTSPRKSRTSPPKYLKKKTK